MQPFAVGGKDRKGWRRASKYVLACSIELGATVRTRLHLGWKILPTRIGFCSYTNCAHRFRCEDNNVAFTRVQPHYYRKLQVEPCHQ